MSYSLQNSSAAVCRIEDGATIPPDPDNRDWQAYQAWLAAGNVPVPADPAAASHQLHLARQALDASDCTVLRCIEVGVAVPPEWVAYRKALRAIVAGGLTALPDAPNYPAGT